MDRIEEIREKIGECDDIIIEQLAVRMSHIQEIISYKKATGIPILQPEQEKKQTDALAQKLGDNEFEEEILDIFKYIMKNSRRIQAKSLFDYNIFLIGFMGAGKSTIAGELKDKLEMDRVEMDQMIVEKQGMSISEIFDEYGEAYFRNLESNTLIDKMTPTLLNKKIPSLTLQLLIENVIKHNIINMENPMVIHLDYSDKDQTLSVRNKIKLKKDVAKSGMGLKNLSARYLLICNLHITIIDDSEYFTVKIPLLNE